MEKQAIGWEKMFANHISDRGLVPRKWEELSKLSKKTFRTQVKNEEMFHQWRGQ